VTARRGNPAWIPPFLGRVPEAVPDHHVSLLGAVAFAIFFENYDQAMLTQAIKQIASDFGVVESELGNLLGFVRLGAIPAFFLIPLADRIGRRRTFLASVLGMSAATTLSAFAPTIEALIGLQMLSRLFMVTAAATAFVIITEEFHAAHRGWGLGIVGAVGTFGVGMSAVLFAGIELLPYGWRAMYLLGVVPALVFPSLRRRVAETRRFDEQQRARDTAGVAPSEWWRPLAKLARAYPLRTLAVGVIGAAASAANGAAYNFSAYFVQQHHGWEPGQYSLMLLAAGTVGILGHPFAGRVADQRGRRMVGFAFYAVFPFLAFGFYTAPGWLLPFLWVPMVFVMTGGITIGRALSTELFPTSFRGTASGYLQLVDTLGAAAALFLISALTATDASAMPAVRAVIWVSLLAALALLILPETGRRELEDISAEADTPLPSEG
jgi:MFS family permease